MAGAGNGWAKWVVDGGEGTASAVSGDASGGLPENATNLLAMLQNYGGASFWAPVTDSPDLPPAGSYTQRTNFYYAGSNQFFVVPAGVTQIIVKAWGAAGGSAGTTLYGGEGGFVYGVVPVTALASLVVKVGGGGGASTTNAPGWPDGGRAAGLIAGYAIVGCGGGSSSVWTGTNPVPENLLIMAGAGGGAAAFASSVLRGNGGWGGGRVGQSGLGYGGGQGGTGGGQVAGGTTNGGFHQGGRAVALSNSYTSGGGGGGGYMGGGGAYVASSQQGAGGGGSCFVPAVGFAVRGRNAVDRDWEPGIADPQGNAVGGNGMVIIFW
jgi:hypothetical protein